MFGDTQAGKWPSAGGRLFCLSTALAGQARRFTEKLPWEMHAFLNLRDSLWLCESFFRRAFGCGLPSYLLSLTEARRLTEELLWEMHAFLNLRDSLWLCESFFPSSFRVWAAWLPIISHGDTEIH